ncbi:MAG: tRNA (adenosine(37)-N6)-threonylcarbamoyltransferase complex dimerization subunit type 1 TsaB [Burkholderiaceae bacterium]|nr:tRNA (adenosine(37)-N6)-threonylcarbamoyltransferase complex dimerization subunit type 1 TsaB [Burkholderiaceae bacterium]
MSTPRLLALDTSTDQLSLALLTPQGRFSHGEAGGAQASAALLPSLQALLRSAGQAMAGPAAADGLQAIAFGRGPGAFTGLRTACAVAQGLGLGLDCPLLAIDSLLIVADDARAQAQDQGLATDGLWWAAVDARMDEVYAAPYEHSSQGWQALAEPALYTLSALAAAWQAAPPVRVAGNASRVFAGRLPLGSAACWPEARDRAAALLRLAEAAWARGETLAADVALPSYLRDKVALTTAERAAQALLK